MEITLAVLLGTIFGFALNRVGAANPNYIINMLRLKDTHLMKTILFAIAIASILLFAGISLGVISAAHLSIKSTYIGVIVGGAIFAIGFAIAGYCPGTGLAAAAGGRKDALPFIAGGLLGALTYIYAYEYIKDTFLMDKIAGGKVMLADIGIEKYESLIHVIPGTVLATIIGLVIIAIAYKLPKKII